MMRGLPALLPAYSFTRPTDTTAYASGDLIANNTAAGSVVPMSWTIPWTRAGGWIVVAGVRLRKSTAGVTNPSFRVHLFSAIPTFTSAGDNGLMTTVVATGMASWLAQFDVTLNSAAVDGAQGLAVAVDSVPQYVKLASGATTLYGLLEARGAYAPGNAEVFTARPMILT